MHSSRAEYQSLTQDLQSEETELESILERLQAMKDERNAAGPESIPQAQRMRYDELRVREISVRTRVAVLRDEERSMRKSLAFLESRQAVLKGYRETHLREAESTKESST